MLKKWYAIILTIGALFFLSMSPAEARGKANNTHYVDVSAATLWTAPDLVREVDKPSAANPVDLRKWTTNMTYEDKLGLVGKLETQALYGSKVTVFEQRGNWVKVAVHNQPTPRNEQGYPGWMPKAQLVKGKNFENKLNQPFALVTSPTAWLYENKQFSKKFMEISFNTRLPVIKELTHEVLVVTPADGMKWLKKKDAAIYKSEKAIPAPTGQDIVNTGKKFLGLPYLWAGMSGFGFDCSGFTYTLYHANGIVIPRDSSVQAKHGTAVERKNLQAGDLLFFAYDQGKGKVHHVAVYIGDGKMIHSPNSSTHVRIDAIETSGYGEEYAGARRYIQ
ncbi:peptidase P60 [Bacillus sp. FJAT-27231]|uniref:C40 family peptidase n=1 Tax=Bacillus sp. FJAT-27231 TaxID=1679168 RepID=UPI0006717118|nr:C40 family peptidase [Bacillus sp. FJAT-27231]KMY54172.1 peptidase P60 [Bacillus sp. FJAT-27231]